VSSHPSDGRSTRTHAILRYVAGIVAGIVVGAGTAWFTGEFTRRDGLPIIVSNSPYVSSDPWRFLRPGPWSPGFDYFIPGAEVPPPSLDDGHSCEAIRERVWSRNAYDVGETWILFTMLGNRDFDVTISDLRVDVLSNDPRPPGIVSRCEGGGGGGSGITPGIVVDLDAAPPTIGYVEDVDAPGAPAAHVPIYTLHPGEQDSVYVFARTTGLSAVRWQLRASVSAGGVTTTLIFDDHGEPFRTVGTTDLTNCWFSDASGPAPCPDRGQQKAHS
jgi:hypothetical protein